MTKFHREFSVCIRGTLHKENVYVVIERTNDREHATARAESVFINTPDVAKVWVTDARGRIVCDRDGREYVWERHPLSA